jgi:hypothetical protein
MDEVQLHHNSKKRPNISAQKAYFEVRSDSIVSSDSKRIFYAF